LVSHTFRGPIVAYHFYTGDSEEVNILGGGSIGNSEKKNPITMRLIPNGYRDRAG
jgi:hypothetical protein